MMVDDEQHTTIANGPSIKITHAFNFSKSHLGTPLAYPDHVTPQNINKNNNDHSDVIKTSSQKFEVNFPSNRVNNNGNKKQAKLKLLNLKGQGD